MGGELSPVEARGGVWVSLARNFDVEDAEGGVTGREEDLDRLLREWKVMRLVVVDERLGAPRANSTTATGDVQ